MADIFSLTDRVAIVTGGTRGIGRSIATGLATAGANVAITGRDGAACSLVAKEIESITGREILGVRAEMAAADDLTSLVEQTVDRFGRLDVLVNNAAVVEPIDLDDVRVDVLHETFQVNMVAPVLLSSLAAKHMQANGSGSIINISSAIAYLGRPVNSAYVSSKAAMLSFTRSCAAKWAERGIRVNALVPGLIETDMAATVPTEQRAHAVSVTLLRRTGQPDEMIGAAVFLASDASSYVTGQALMVDGGMVQR